MKSRLFKNPAVLRECIQEECNAIMRMHADGFTAVASYDYTKCDIDVDAIMGGYAVAG